jgi:Zn-dependent metalloprotease
MKHSSLKVAGVAGALFFASFSYGQQKQLPVPNVKNPFQAKTDQSQSTLITPTKQAVNASVQHSTRPVIKIVNGSFSANLQKQRVSKESVVRTLNSLLNVNQNHSSQPLTENKDELGFTHTTFQQVYKGLPVEGQQVFLHAKNDLLTSINGQITQDLDLQTQVTITAIQAIEIAKRETKVTALIEEYPVETLITAIPGEKGKENKLVHKVRIDSYSPLVMCHVYVDANTGEVVNKINLIAHADVPATGQTYYSGAQSITVDSYAGSYRLRENGRKIQTYNATNADEMFTTSGFIGAEDFVSNSTTFGGLATLNSFTIAAISQGWWYNALSDQSPDLYIVVKDVTNQVVYTSNVSFDTPPPLAFNNLNLLMTNGPYKVEVWDYDSGSDDDLGGTYTLSSTAGTQSWSGNGNNGSYVIGSSGNPGIDVHWGMEKSYDFYLNVFSRNSFDGAGGIIKQYVNPPTLQTQYGNSPNNAGAYPAPYNFMVYGLGDGVFMSPVVGLDVEGHEFTHMVVANNGHGGLTYQGESGALNESFADIFGVCIEFYSGLNADWLMGEDIMVSDPYLRSMSNPNGGDQPDTYGGMNWINPDNLSYDRGGVHINSGVQNYWFYLLCQGGSGTNDNGDSYSVTGIGITQARAIAYRNLLNYLGPNATFQDAYAGSLQATEDLYGNPSVQYTAVKEAWFAVGVGNTPIGACAGVTELTASSGTFTDGSGSADYNNDANCAWLIAPAGATSITLTFTAFNTESGYDYVTVYNGPDDSYAQLGRWSGVSLPSSVSTTNGVGAMYIKFTSDENVTGDGWTANYTTTAVAPSCSGGTVLTTTTGSFTDGSGTDNYSNNQSCTWYIAPACMNSIALTFTAFDTELDYDGVAIYDDWDGTHQIGLFSGNTIPPTVTSTTGKMMVVFITDNTITRPGFAATYSSAGVSFCSGTTVLNTDEGDFADGSGASDYCDNTDCRWLIQPPSGNVTLHFSAFDLESASLDGQTIYDVVEVYDGTTTSATLLGRFAGSNIPPSVTSTSGSLLVRFKTDFSLTRSGWAAYYTSTQNSACSGFTTLTAASGTLSDGSGANDYANNVHCSWLIQPANAQSITLAFSAFVTESYYDGVTIYNGANSSAQQLGQFSGSSLPPSVTSTGGSMFIDFVSDPSIREQGWTASYTSSTVTGVGDAMMKEKLQIFPNPTEGLFTVQSEFDEVITFQLIDMMGKQVVETNKINKGRNQIDASELNKGVYLIKLTIGDTSYVEKLVIE